MGVLTIRKDTSSGTVLHTEQRLSTPSYSPTPTGSITSGATWNCKNKVPNANIVIGGKTFATKDKMMDRNFWAKYDESQPFDIYKNGVWASGLSANSLVASTNPVFYKTFNSNNFQICSERNGTGVHGMAYLNFAIPWGYINAVEIDAGAANGYMMAFLTKTLPSSTDFNAHGDYMGQIYPSIYIYPEPSIYTYHLDTDHKDYPRVGIIQNVVNLMRPYDYEREGLVGKTVYLCFSDIVQATTWTTIKRITLKHV